MCEKVRRALIQSMTATNQGLHCQLCIESTQSKDFATLTLLHHNFPSPECWWCSAVVLSHLWVYTPLAQLHPIQKALNRSWCHFSLIVQGVLKSHRTGEKIILDPPFLRPCKIVTHKHASSVYFLWKAARRIILLQQCNYHLNPFSFDFLARDCRQG